MSGAGARCTRGASLLAGAAIAAPGRSGPVLVRRLLGRRADRRSAAGSRPRQRDRRSSSSGASSSADTHASAGRAIVGSPIGYDGQFYWVQARDPFAAAQRDASQTIDAAGRAYDLQRMAYPAPRGRCSPPGSPVRCPGRCCWSTSLAIVLAITGRGRRLRPGRGRSVWWALAVGLTPGLVMGTLRDLGDPLATAAMLGGLIAYERGRRWPAAALLALAVLAREPMIVAVAAVGGRPAGCPVASRRAAPDEPGAASLRAWPVVVRARRRCSSPGSSTPEPARPAGSDAVTHAHARRSPVPPVGQRHARAAALQRLRRSRSSAALTHDYPGSAAAWDLVYIALVLGRAWSAVVAALRRGPWAATRDRGAERPRSSSVIYFGDEWGVSRYGAPAVRRAAAGRPARPACAAPPRLCAAAARRAVIPFVVPLVIPGSVTSGDAISGRRG